MTLMLRKPHAVDFIATALVFTLFTLVFFHYLPHEMARSSMDWAVHSVKAQEGNIPPHFVYAIIARITGLSTLNMAVAVGIVKSTLFFTLIRLFFARSPYRHLIGLSILVAMPVFFLNFLDLRPYLGKISPNVVHNPTYIYMQPLALLLWWQFTFMVSKNRIRSGDCMLAFVLGILAVSAKPSFHLSFIPVAALFVVALARGSGFLLGAAYLLALVLPLAIQSWALLFLFDSWSTEERYSFELRPFAALNEHVVNYPLTLLSSFLFPLLALPILMYRRSFDKALFYACALLLSGALVAIIFADGGEMLRHGNFIWSAHIALFILLVQTSRSASVSQSLTPLEGNIIWGALAVHALCGILYLLAVMAGMSPLSGYRSSFQEWLP